MKIAVCIKRVPDTATKIRIAADGQSIDPADVQYVISPYDEFAIEEAIQIKDRAGGGEVTVFCFGPAAAQKDLRQALAMGADQAILITHEGGELDPYQISQNLAAALRDRDDDLVLMGRQSVDAQNGQVGPMTARLLGRPCVTDVVKVEVGDGQVTSQREVEGGRETVVAALPAVLTTQKGINDPRYPSLKGIMAAKKKPLDSAEPTAAESQLGVTSLELPPPRPEGRIVGEGTEAVAELVRLLREEAKVI